MNSEPLIMDKKSMSGAGLRAFFQIADLWKISSEESRILLGSIPRSTYFKWKSDQNVKLPKDALERISYILGIYKGLQILFSNSGTADKWVSQPNTAAMFRGRSALDLMLSGNVADLYLVRKYIDAIRGGWS